MVDDVALLETVEEREMDKNLFFSGECNDESSGNELVRCSQYSYSGQIQPDEVFNVATTSRSKDANEEIMEKPDSSHTSREADTCNLIEKPSEEDPVDQDEDETGCISSHSLRFEVSKYTGRIHLYSCIQGIETRPTPLFKNFKPEELETKDPDNLADSIYKPALVKFVKEWNTQNHDKDGLLKGGSKKRGTSIDDISHPLPANAEWRKVSIFHGKKERRYMQGYTLINEPLCKLCQKICTKKSAMEPEFFEDLFCDLECHEEYRLRTSNRLLRKMLAQIEHSVCTNCHLDCRKLVKNIKPLSLEKRREFIMREAPKLAARKNALEKLISDPTEGNAWHADHIVPVYRGGGECRLENMRTLCIACHADVTLAQCRERRSERAKAKKQLKRLLANITLVNNCKDKETDDDDLLVVNVPGSAYHTIQQT
ncbi:unnamed protein product [Lactuca virosa]|uniref:HNH domain-containing protein n=1 Tax=Lactuca virosa TaxID=75947 RepID=A0AAU9MVX9_9ASTR|nr:unnamed protein product [Lactuca virosa]